MKNRSKSTLPVIVKGWLLGVLIIGTTSVFAETSTIFDEPTVWDSQYRDSAMISNSDGGVSGLNFCLIRNFNDAKVLDYDSLSENGAQFSVTINRQGEIIDRFSFKHLADYITKLECIKY